MSSDEFGRSGDPGVGDEFWTEPTVNIFTQEIENVDASDWAIDSDSLWGDEGTDVGLDLDGGPFDIDFPG